MQETNLNQPPSPIPTEETKEGAPSLFAALRDFELSIIFKFMDAQDKLVKLSLV